MDSPCYTLFYIFSVSKGDYFQWDFHQLIGTNVLIALIILIAYLNKYLLRKQ